MPPRSTPPPKGSSFPPNDVSTYRDLLLFEERLKSNAASLQRRKARYQLFLFQLLLIITFLLAERLLPEIYTSDVQVTIHPYFTSGLLFVSVTTLVLFFASGMYSEKIAYANKISAAQIRAPRQPRAALLQYVPQRPQATHHLEIPLQPAVLLLPPSQRTLTHPPTHRTIHATLPLTISCLRRWRPVPVPLSLLLAHLPPDPLDPPATNPRGELIFSSRVEKSFREPYERYRAAFERKREEREREKMLQASWWRWMLRRWYGPVPVPQAGRGGSPLVGSAPPLRAAGSSSSSSAGTVGRKARLSRSATPEASGGAGGIMMRQREKSGTPLVKQETPPTEQEGCDGLLQGPPDILNTLTDASVTPYTMTPGTL
ncbi:putative spo7-like protein [Lyophyllum shimeji]|uniref:Transmembrane protein 188 n=1 Tax=Lyophyllum shimeji TaxID=47721 RepID=A0A9P3PR49_LYOSH|nr:putative spo7-like protein [Lyophyllum shimeji]